jgi:hypothetical protein
MIFSLPATTCPFGDHGLTLWRKFISIWAWYPLLCFDVFVNEIVELILAELALGLHNLSRHERFICLVSCRGQTGLNNWLLRLHFVNSSVLEVGLYRGETMWAVRCRLLSEEHTFIDVTMSLTLELEAPQKLWFCWLVIDFVCCCLREPFLFLSFLDVG